MKPDDTPVDHTPPESPQPVTPEAPIVPATPATPPLGSEIGNQWQTKADYVQTQAAQPAIPLLIKGAVSTSKLTRYAAIALGVSVLLFILATTTSLGEIGSFTGMSSRAQIAKPMIGVAASAVLISYFTMVISGIATSRGKAAKRVSSIVGLSVGAVLVLNPLGLIIVGLTINCNFQSCSGT